MLTSAALASLAALTLAALPSSEPVEFACCNALPSKEFLDTSSKLRAAEHSLASQGELAAAEIVIDTHVHIVAANNTADSGYASVSVSLRSLDIRIQTRPPPSRDSPKPKKLMPSSPPVARSHPRPDGRPGHRLRQQRHQVRPQVPRPHHQCHLVQRRRGRSDEEGPPQGPLPRPQPVLLQTAHGALRRPGLLHTSPVGAPGL